MENAMRVKKETQGSHMVWLDYLRMISCLAVMMIHVSGQNLSQVEILSYHWFVFTFFNWLSGWAVNIFIMISGTLFLDNSRPVTLKKLYGQKLVRIVTAYLFWAAVYALEKYFTYRDLKIALTMFLEGRYHMWYLYMTAGLYIATPVLRKITESKEITEYFLAVTFVFVILVPELFGILKLLKLPHTAVLLEILPRNFNTIQFPFPVIHAFYYVLGFYLGKYGVSATVRRVSYAAGVVGFFMILVLCTVNACLTGSGDIALAFYPCVFSMSAGLFLFAKYNSGFFQSGTGRRTVLQTLSRYSFGAYLVHPLVLSQLRDRLSFTTMSFDPLLSVLALEICVALVSFAVSALLNHIPVLKKYIV